MTTANFRRPLGAPPVIDAPASVAFPQTKADSTLVDYFLQYRTESRAQFFAWIKERYDGAVLDSPEQLRFFARAQAVNELGRALRDFESLALASATRDWFNARAAMSAMDRARQRGKP